MNSFTVIIPALNEEGTIGETVDRTRNAGATEVIVVDDGSSDRTGDLAKQHGAIVIRHPAPGGYGKSLKDGIKAAKNDIVVIADADGTYPLERSGDLVSLLHQGYDMVVGARTGPHYRGSFLKMPARILFKWLVEFTTGRRIPDINSGFRAFRVSTVLKYERDLCNTFSFTTTLTLIYMLTGKFVEYVSIDYNARIGHSKVKLVRDSLRTLQYIVEVIAKYNPLKLFALLALLLLSVSAASAVLLLVSDVWDTAFAFISVLSFIGACVVFAVGLHAVSMTRTERSTV